MLRPRHIGTPRRIVELGALGAVIAMGISMTAPAGHGDDDERIIVGSVGVHGFQRNEPDDEATPVDIENVSLGAILGAMGERAELWYAHATTLANPYFEGRAPGTEGNRRAAEYLEFYMRRIGLEPAFPAEGDDADGVWTSYRQSFTPGRRDELLTDNVGGVLYGRGDLADEWIVIGAHYDHVGYARPGNGAGDAPVHPGADDNASGTAGMLVLAKRFADEYTSAPETADLRSILFMGFSAEEMGLLGSRHYVRNATLSADKIHLMLNLDMIGRLRNDTLLVQGVHSADGLLDRIRPHLLESGLTIYADPNGRGPSDHSSFYSAGIPVLFMFTGTHDVYHQPGDVASTLNPLGATRILDLMFEIGWDMTTSHEALAFSRAEPQRASLGVVARPDRDADGRLRVVDFYENSAAEDSGLQKGDLLLKWNGENLADWNNLRERLSSARVGQTVTLTIEREGEEHQIEIKLSARRE